MKAKKFSARLLSLLLAIAMVAALVPAGMAFAADEDASGQSGVVVSKTATLEDDGTYTINLEAYATGETTTVTEKSGTPLDIVLVIDQSGSMAYNDNGRNTDTSSDRRMEKLKDAVKSFVNSISANGKEYNVDHKIALVGYASNRNAGQSSKITGIGYNGSRSYWVNTGLYVNGSFKNYAGNSNTSSLTAQDYKNALVSVNDANGNVTSSITASINLFKASGGTYTEYGLTMAQKIFDNNPIEAGSNRKRIVVLFTDGETDSGISTVLNGANTLKGSAYNATIYSVGFGSSVNTDFLSHVSSNYTSASYSSNWLGSYYSGTKVADKYSMTASNREELNNIFNNISQDVQNPSTTVTLNAESVMRDVLGTGFTLPDGFDVTKNVSIKTVAGSTTDGKTITWGAETTSPAGIAAKVEGNTINVTGFNYSEKYIAPGHDGEKLMVTIKGILPTDAAVTGEEVYTNDAASGIYATATAESCIPFPQPKTILTSKAYVLDYAKAFTMNASDWKQTSAMLYGSFEKDTANPKYGNLSGLEYTPKTTNWNGYDTFYAFGKTTDETVTSMEANKNGNLWSKVSVIPATSVYYEDDFETTKDGSRVGIKYTGTWTTDGTSSGNTETPNGPVDSWEGSLADDTGYSDGSAHVSSTGGATASFTFTGTGVDIYSRTNDETGTIYATIQQTVDGTTTTKRYVVDNKAKSGDYYQIPTLTFAGEYGTYKVTIRVTTGAVSEGRYTYYLDGIRVYNPIQNPEDDEIVAGAYGDKLGAAFTEVRSLLDANSGVAFVDEDANGNPVNKNYADAEISQYAPEHEVYLAAGQSIIFKAGTAGGYYVGLKAPDGNGTSVAFSQDENAATTTITHTTDLYYKVSAGEDGTIVIKNTGANLLSITKICTTSGGAVGTNLTGEEAAAAVTAFSARSVVPYSAEPVENPDETEPEAPVEPETPDEPGDVVIDNPEQPEDPPAPSTGNSGSWLEKLFGTIRGWFRP